MQEIQDNPNLLKETNFEPQAPTSTAPNQYITKMREMYPMYESIDDTTLALAFKKKHYANYGDDEFLQTIGLNQVAPVVDTENFETPSDDVTATRESEFNGVDESGNAKYITPAMKDEQAREKDKQMLFGNGEDFVSKEWNFADEVIKPFASASQEVAQNNIMAEAVLILGDDANDPKKLAEFLKFKDELDGYNPMHWIEKNVANADVEKNTAKHSVDTFLEAYKKEGVLSTDTWLEFLKAIPSVTAGSVPNTAQVMANLPKATISYAYKLAKDSLVQDGINTEPTREDMAKSAPVATLIMTLDKFGFSKASAPLKEEIAKAIVKNPAKKIVDVLKSFTGTTVHGVKYELPTEIAQEVAEVLYVKDKDVTGEDILKSSIGAVMGTAGMTTGISGAKEIVSAVKPTSKEGVIADALSDAVENTQINQEVLKANVRESLSPKYAQYQQVQKPKSEFDKVQEGFKALEEELFSEEEKDAPVGLENFTGESESVVEPTPIQKIPQEVQEVASSTLEQTTQESDEKEQRIKELEEKSESELTTDEKWELEDLQAERGEQDSTHGKSPIVQEQSTNAKDTQVPNEIQEIADNSENIVIAGMPKAESQETTKDDSNSGFAKWLEEESNKPNGGELGNVMSQVDKEILNEPIVKEETPVQENKTEKPLSFDTQKLYSTKGINQEIPSQEVSNRIQKDVAKYVKALAEKLGYEIDIDKKGKPLAHAGVRGGIAPAGGDMSFNLWKPNSQHGIYMSFHYNLEADGEYDAYRLRGSEKQLWRVTTKADKYRGLSNQWIANDRLTDDSFVKSMSEAVNRAEERAKNGIIKNDEKDTKENTNDVQNDEGGKDRGTSAQEDSSESIESSETVKESEDARVESRDEAKRDTELQVHGSNTDGGSESSPVQADGEREESSTVSARDSQSDDRGDGYLDKTRDGNQRGERGSDTPVHSGDVSETPFVHNTDDVIASGEVARYNANIEAIKLLSQNKTHYTQEEKQILSRYTSWGGLQKAFKDGAGQFKEGWEERGRELQSLLSHEEYTQAQKSVLDAYYTPLPLVKAMWDISLLLGYKGGLVLEPSMGTGRFIGMTPSDVRGSTSFSGVEIDKTTYKIATALYGKLNARNRGFETTNYKGTYDLVIGNPPYGSFRLYDKNNKAYNTLTAHNYFVVKSLDALKEGGVLNFVISSSFMDNLDAKTIELIDSKAKFIGAIRLPSDAFSDAGTKVTTDIILFQKLKSGEKGNSEVWAKSGKLNGLKINQYFVDNSSMLLGEWVKGFRGAGTLEARENTLSELVSAIDTLPRDIMETSKHSVLEQAQNNSDASVPPSVMYVKDGKVYVNVKEGENLVGEEIKAPKEKAQMYIELRESLLELIDMQLNENITEESVEAQRAKVNEAYEKFTKKYGALNKTANRSFIVKDKNGYLVSTLEEGYQPEIKKGNKRGLEPQPESFNKADILTKRTASPVKEIKTSSSTEALTLSLNIKGGINFEYMQRITDKSKEQLLKELHGKVFFDVDAGYVTRDVYLSGDVKTKYANAVDEYSKSELAKVIPADLSAKDITPEIGQRWIGVKPVEQFMKEKLGYRHFSVSQSRATSKWFVEGWTGSFPFGADGVKDNTILESALNNKQVKVYTTFSDGSRTINTEKTDLANAKVEELKEAFSDWVFSDKARRDELVARYNELNNRFAPLQVEDNMKNYEIPNIKFFKPREHQRRAVYKASFGNTPLLLNHTVGSGKTLTSQMIAMEWRRLGKAKKPLIATLKSVVPQYAKEFKEAYPSAKILVPTESDFTPANRKILLSAIATGDYDAIIISHEQLQKIENPVELQKQIIDEEIAELEQALQEMKANRESQRSRRDIENAKEKLKTKFEKLSDQDKDNVLSFEKLGVDGLIVDESHKFKKLAYSTTLGQIKGMPSTTGSNMAFDLHVKTRHILDSNNGRNVVFMTGTPITNTIPELYLIQKYLQANTLYEQGVQNFDSWAKNYVEQTTEVEITSTGGFKEVTRIKNFKNMSTLIQTTSQIIDTVTNEDIKKSDKNFKLPPLKDGKPTLVFIEPSEEQLAYNQELIERVNNLTKDSPDNHLVIFNDAGKMSIDMRLVSDKYGDSENSKVNSVVSKALQKYKEFDSVKGTQLIFSDTGTPKGGGKAKAKLEALMELADKGDESASKELESYSDAEIEDILKGGVFSVYEDIKKKLVLAGVPESEVVFIHDYETKEKKQQLGREVNAGKIRFVIGSTQKLGTGINVQQRLTAVHHIDIPYTPAELEQRNGRIIRQGNKLLSEIDNFEVEILYYATKRTLDGMKWQILENKSKFIKQFFDGINDDELEIEEMSSSELAEVMKAEASGNPLLLEKIKTEKKLKKLRSLKRSHELSKAEIEDKLLELAGFLGSVDADIASLEEDIKQIKNNPVIVGDKKLEKSKEIGDALIEQIESYKKAKGIYPKTIGSVGDIEIAISYEYTRERAIISLTGESVQEITYDYTKPSGNGLGVIFTNRLKSYETKRDVLVREKPQAQEDVKRLEESKGSEFPKMAELKEAESEQARIIKEIAESAKEKKPESQESRESDSYMKNNKAVTELEKFIARSLQQVSNKNEKFDLGKVDAEIASRIFKETGVNIKDFSRYIDSNHVKHTIKEHGDKEKEGKRNQVPISIKDIALIPIIVSSFDNVKKSVFADEKGKKRTRLVFEKKFNDDGVVMYVEAINFNPKNKEVFLKTMYKRETTKNPQSFPVTNPDSTQKGGGAGRSFSTKSIAYNEIKAKKKTKEDEANNSYSKANGYDEAGINYVPTYAVMGMPARPVDGVIKIGDKEVSLPSLQEPINADSIRVYLSDIIGQRLYEGRIKGKSALGVYRRNDSSIRVKNYSDIEVMAHELAHYLDFFHKNRSKDAKGSFFRAEILKNKEEIKTLSYTTKDDAVIKEGFAEFVRLWLTNYNTVKGLAPNMVKDFEARLAKDKELQAKMQRVQEGMHAYYYQGEHAQLRSKRGGELNSTAKKIQRSQQEIARDIRQQAIDKIHTIKRIEAEIQGDVGSDAIDSAYKALQMVNGHSSIMYGAMNIGVPTIVDGDITYSGKSLNAIFEPATKVGEERVRLLEDYLVAKRASELMEQGRENLITKEEIEVGLKLAESYPEFESIFEEYQEFNNAMLDFYVDMKLITDEQRESFMEFNKNYVPFHRITESVQYGEVPPARIGQRLTGGTHSLGNIMENIINGVESNIKEALISRGKSLFYEMLEKSGTGGAWAIRVGTDSKKVHADVKEQAKSVATIMASLGLTVAKDGMILSGDINAEQIIDIEEIENNLLLNPETLEFWTHGHKPKSKGGYIDSAIINGKRVYFETFDKGLVDAMTSFSSAHYGAFVQSLMAVKNVITWNITNNPLFYLTNFARDTVSASVLSKNNFVPVYTSLVGMYHFITGSKVYKEFMSSGGGNATRRTNLGSDIDAMQMLNVNRGFDLFGKIVSAFEYGADLFENGTRIGDFALSQKAGKSNWQSAYESREISTDFAIKGSNKGFTGFMATVPFMKAGLNGIDKTARRIFSLNGEMKVNNALKFRNELGELQAHKIKIYATGGVIAGITLALFLQNRDDDRYKRLTRDQKLMYWNFFIGDKHYKIPRPYDIGFMFSAIPEIIAEAIYTKDGEEALENFVWGIKTMFSIGDVSGLFQPILEDMKNENWTGSPIVPMSVADVKDKADQYIESTPLMYREFAKISGFSPIKTQHYVDGYLGLTAKMIEEGMENLLWNEKEWGARPFAQNPLEFLTYRFKGKEQDQRTKWSEKYYELNQKAKEYANSLSKKKDRAFKDAGTDAKEFIKSDENKRYIVIQKKLASYNRMLANIKRGVESIYYDKSLSKEEKEKRINEAYKMRTEFFEKIVTKVEELSGE